MSFAFCKDGVMERRPENRELAERLKGIGISESYASQLVNGRRTPSLRLALRIEQQLGIPASNWSKAA